MFYFRCVEGDGGREKRIERLALFTLYEQPTGKSLLDGQWRIQNTVRISIPIPYTGPLLDTFNVDDSVKFAVHTRRSPPLRLPPPAFGL